MLKCPYCYNPLEKKPLRCPHCEQYILDELADSDFPSRDKKKCIFCGEQILQSAKVCQHCHKWLDEVDRDIGNIDSDDIFLL